MGFPSPATDYVEQRLSPASTCTTNESRIIETTSGFGVIEPVSQLVQRQALLILSDGRTQFTKLTNKALIMDDGEATKGEAAEKVEVIGREMYFISRSETDDIPL